MKSMGASMTRKELAEVAGYSYHGLYNINRSLPEGKKLFVDGEGGKVDLSVFVQRWVEYNVEIAVARAGGGENDLDSEKARHERLKADKAEIEVGRMRGEYVNINDVTQLWTEIHGVVVNRLINLPKKLAPQLVMIDSAEIAEGIIERDLRDALNLISTAPLPGENESMPAIEEGDGGTE